MTSAEPSAERVPVPIEDIMVENRGPPVKLEGDFPYPQSTTISKNLSPNVAEDLSIITNGATIPNSDIIIETRNGGTDNISESHFPQYYRKDTMSGSTIGTTEYSFAEVDNTKSSCAWSDQNVSQYPTFYTSDDKGGLTNSGSFSFKIFNDCNISL